MPKKFTLAIEIGGVLKESFKSAVGISKRELRAVQRLANIKIGASLKLEKEKLKKQLSEWKSILGTAATMAAPVITGANFEYQMKRVKALANATNEEFNKLEEKAKQLGATTQYSASEVGKAMEYLSMAGFKVGETLAATGGVLNLATVGNIDLGTSADIATNILSGFGLKAKEINRVVDVMAKTITSSNTSVVELGETMKYVAPIASKVGASIEEVSAMTGLLANVGIKGSQAGTTLRAMFLRISAPTGEAAKALAMLGVKTKDAQGNIRPMTEILADLDKQLRKLSPSMRMQYLKSIFGEEAASGVAELLKRAGTGELQKYIKEIKNAKGTAEKMVKDMNDTVLMRWKSVLSAVEGIFLTLYKPLEPIIKFALDIIVGGLRTLNKVLEFTAPVLSPVIFGFGSLYVVSKLVSIGMTLSKIASLGFVQTLIMSLTPVGQAQKALRLLAGEATVTSNVLKLSSFSLKGFFGSIKAFAISAFTAIRTLGAALLTNPIFWIGVAIAGIGYLIYRNWDKLKNFFKGFWAGIREGFKPVIELMRSISNVFSPLFGFMKKIGAAIGSMLSNQKLMFTVGRLIGKTLTLAFSPLIWGAKAINFVIGLFEDVGSAILQGFSPLGAVVEKFKPIFNTLNNIKNFATKIFSFVLGSFKITVEGVAKFVKTIFIKNITFIKSAFVGLGGVIKSIFTTPIKVVEFLIGKIKYVFSLLKNNPLTKAVSLGKSIIGGAVSKTKEFFTSVFSSKETVKEKQKSIRETIEKKEFSGGSLGINKLVEQLVVNINASSKEIAKEVELQIPEIKEKLMAVFEELMEEYERRMRLSHGR